MSAVQMRPTFFFETELGSEEVIRRIQEFVAKFTGKYKAQFANHQAMISIDESKRHFWSPWLHLDIRENETGRQVFCRFSPHPSIWTGFMFSYLAIGVLIFFATMLGVSQQLSSQAPWAYYVIPIGLIVAVVLWFASKAGQKLAHAEMVDMKSMVETCVAGEV